MESKGSKEYCIICGKETPFYRHQNTDWRKFYIYGAGQLCQQCYESIFHISKTDKE